MEQPRGHCVRIAITWQQAKYLAYTSHPIDYGELLAGKFPPGWPD